jgi:hypothetical protein
MDRGCDTMFAVAEERGLPYRTAALTYAMQQVYDATLIRGIYP